MDNAHDRQVAEVDGFGSAGDYQGLGCEPNLNVIGEAVDDLRNIKLDPFVVDGLGAPKGLHPLEHVQWAEAVQHPFSARTVELEPDLDLAVRTVLEMQPRELDEHRRGVLRSFLAAAGGLEESRAAWTRRGPAEAQLLLQRLHGPMLEYLIRILQWPDLELAGHLRGFPIAGHLPPAHYASQPPRKLIPRADAENLVAEIPDWNLQVLRALKDLPYSHDIAGELQKDVDLGAMLPATLLTDDHVREYLLMRRLPVRELRSAGWKTRIADHGTECGINPNTSTEDTIKHDTVDVLMEIELRFLQAGRPRLSKWKRDVKRAFKRIPVMANHRRLTGAVWQAGQDVWFSRHIGMPFGTTSAGLGWHRLANVVMAFCRRLLFLTAGRYVDDSFGVDEDNVQITGGYCMQVISSVLGLELDAEKAEDTLQGLIVLGVLVQEDPRNGRVEVQVTAEKAKAWSELLQKYLQDGRCEAGDSGKLAGRLSFAVTMAADKVGRAYIRPFYAQQHDPLPDAMLSSRWKQAARWWIHYLEARPPAYRSIDDQHREQVQLWTDAAGESRGLAAVLRVGSSFWYTYTKLPEAIWDLLIPRGDHQIGVQETLAVVLALGTFQGALRGKLVLSFIDNDGVRANIQSGSSRAPETNGLIGSMWLHIASQRIGLYTARVESKANIADGPSRFDFDLMERLGALSVSPVWPPWTDHFWSIADPLHVAAASDSC